MREGDGETAGMGEDFAMRLMLSRVVMPTKFE